MMLHRAKAIGFSQLVFQACVFQGGGDENSITERVYYLATRYMHRRGRGRTRRGDAATKQHIAPGFAGGTVHKNLEVERRKIFARCEDFCGLWRRGKLG